jgi:hypothetical protein
VVEVGGEISAGNKSGATFRRRRTGSSPAIVTDAKQQTHADAGGVVRQADFICRQAG